MNNTIMTCSQDAGKQTDRTDQTDFLCISNADFMDAMFGALEGDCKAFVVSKKGNPTNASWHGGAWQGNNALPNSANNYFSLASFHPDNEGMYKRQKKHCAAIHVIVLDDVGQKVACEKITLAPSYILETSQGNFQYGYRLHEALTDLAVADRLADALADAGLTDAGMKGFSARLARLPNAINGKYNPAFACRLHEWKPELSYSIEELCEGLGIGLAPEVEPKHHRANEPQAHGLHESLYTPAPNSNPVLVALQQRRLYKNILAESKHDITCPYVHEHTDQLDSGTVYYEPSEHYPIGGFKCQHGHCAQRNIATLLEALCIDTAHAKMKPIIRVRAGELHKIADCAEKILADTKEYYQRGSAIVSVVYERDSHKTRIQPASQASLTYTLSRLIEWQRFDAKSKKYVTADPEGRVVNILHDHRHYRHLPALSGLAYQPYLRDDHSLVTQAGYDSQSQIYGIFNPDDYHVKAHHTKKDAYQAMAVIEKLLEDFCFYSPHDKASALSAMLTAACRPSLPTAPMFHVRAPMIGSGKSYLCELIAAFASSHRSTPCAFPADEEECRKLLLAAFLTAPPVIEFDNLTTDIKAHKSLCTALTSPNISDRILGVSKTAEVGTRSLMLSSGNNVVPINDMVRRCITITLDTKEEIPATRTYKNPHLIPDMQTKRAHYISAALTIIMAWVQSGEAPPACKPLGSYGAWEKLCRHPLLWLGYADPVQSMFTAMQDDPERETLGQILSLWFQCYGNSPKQVRQLLDVWDSGSPHAELRELFEDIAGERGSINRKRLGHYLKQHANRPVQGLRLERVLGNRNAALWRVIAL